MDLKKNTIHALSESLNAKEISSLELCQAYLQNIDARDGEINAFL